MAGLGCVPPLASFSSSLSFSFYHESAYCARCTTLISSQLGQIKSSPQCSHWRTYTISPRRGGSLLCLILSIHFLANQKAIKDFRNFSSWTFPKSPRDLTIARRRIRDILVVEILSTHICAIVVTSSWCRLKKSISSSDEFKKESRLLFIC